MSSSFKLVSRKGTLLGTVAPGAGYLRSIVTEGGA